MRPSQPMKSGMTVTIRQGVTYAKGNMLIGDPKTPAGKRKMLILPGLLEVLELSEAEKNDPEAYIIPSLKDPHEPISFWLMSVRLQGSAQTICNDIFAEGLIQFV